MCGVAGWRNSLSLLPFAHQRCKASWWAAHAVLSTSSYCLPQPPAALRGWVNEQQSCRHSPAFVALATFGKSCQPPPCRQGLQCSTAIPGCVHRDRPWLVQACGLWLCCHGHCRALLSQGDQATTPGTAPCLLQHAPSLLSSVWAEIGLLLSWFPEETRVMQPWVPAWKSPPLPGMSTGMFDFRAPEVSRSRRCVRIPVPCRAAAGAWHSPIMHRLPGAQAAPTQPVVWGAGGS